MKTLVNMELLKTDITSEVWDGSALSSHLSRFRSMFGCSKLASFDIFPAWQNSKTQKHALLLFEPFQNSVQNTNLSV